MNLNIYQYSDPAGEPDPVYDGETRTVWIAADNQVQADALAHVHGYTPAGGLVFTPEQHGCESAEQLLTIGVDIVIEGGGSC